mmetsp:Transcript_27199/g.90448  ORF Transcript_27199/g.90448 Transcript_27199/m.90448 type:complete len:314 (+) Transcript_27199:245-1186(+)
MHACEVGRDCADRCAPFARVNKCFPPLKPTSCAKPPTGTLRLPVANCSRSCMRSCRPSAAHWRTICQNQRTSWLPAERPPASREFQRQSSTSMSRMPASSPWTSVGESILRASSRTAGGTTACRPSRMAAMGPAMEPRSLHSNNFSRKSSLFDSETSLSCPPGTNATCAPFGRQGRNFSGSAARRSPGKTSSGATASPSSPKASAASAAAASAAAVGPSATGGVAGASAGTGAGLSADAGAGAGAMDAAAASMRTSAKGKSKPKLATSFSSNHCTLCLKSSASMLFSLSWSAVHRSATPSSSPSPALRSSSQT